jgi:hypothetical protein
MIDKMSWSKCQAFIFFYLSWIKQDPELERNWCLAPPDGNGSVRSVASQTRNEEWVILTGHRYFCGRQCPALDAQLRGLRRYNSNEDLKTRNRKRGFNSCASR